MNTMYQVEDFFVRIQADSSRRLKLTVWNNFGEKLVSDYISAASLDNVWHNIAENSSESVVESIKNTLMDKS